jgi:RNA polymerase I-specific transcription initiation factor RRN3
MRTLTNTVQDASLPTISRAACAAYLASFVARCVAVPPTLVMHALDALTRFAETYTAASETTTATNNTAPAAPPTEPWQDLTAKHGVYYATVQAVLYVLCYHLEALMGHTHTHHHKLTVQEAVRQLVAGRVAPLLLGPLRPTAVCLPSVVTEFRAQASAHALLPAHVADTLAVRVFMCLHRLDCIVRRAHGEGCSAFVLYRA